MTTIAWDGKVLAGDRQRTEYGTPTKARKVYRVRSKDGRRFLIGCTGDSDDCVAMVRWLKGRGDKPVPKALGVISIDERGRVWLCGEKLVWYQIKGLPYWSIGSGSDYALGAMAAGKSARDALRIATRLDVSTGGGVDVVSFR